MQSQRSYHIYYAQIDRIVKPRGKDTVRFAVSASYNIFPKVVTQEEINELIRKLEPYNVSINTIKLMQ